MEYKHSQRKRFSSSSSSYSPRDERIDIRCSNSNTDSDSQECLTIGLEFENNLQFIENFLKELLIKKQNLVETDELVNCSLILAYKIPDKSFYLTLLEQYNNKLLLLTNEEGQSLLCSIVEDEEWNILTKTLDKCYIDVTGEDFLVYLSLLILQKHRDIGIFNAVVRSHFPRNSFLTNDETFLTNAIKKNFTEDLLIQVIMSKSFDINKANKNGETPLILACNTLLVEVVKALLEYNCDVQSQIRTILTSTMSQNSSANSAKKTEIMLLLYQAKQTQAELEFEPLTPEFETKYLVIFPKEMKMILHKIVVLMVTHSGNISQLSNDGDSVISLAYKLDYKRIIKMLIGNYNATLTLVNEAMGRSLLKNMVTDKEHNLFRDVFGKCIITEEDDYFLLELALIAAKQSACDVCKVILSKCLSRNKILLNNETFLTNLVKEDIERNILIDLIKSKLFDVNVPNGSNETVLIMICERLISDAVEVLIECGADVSLMNFKAAEVAILKARNGSVENVNAKNKILDLLFKSVTSPVCTDNSFSGLKSEIARQTIDEVIVTEVQLSLSAIYPVTLNGVRRSSRTSLLEMFIFALFAKSDFMDYLFRLNIDNSEDYNSEIDGNSRELCDFLSSKIVYPLRKYGFIDQKRIFEFVGVIRRHDTFSLTSEKDIDITDVAKLFASLSTVEPLMSFINIRGSSRGEFYLSLLARPVELLLNISVQDLLNLHMVQQNQMFATIPTCVILEIPRHKKGYGNFNNIIPSKIIDISKIFLHYNKICYLCNDEAIYCCSKCVESHKFHIECGWFCIRHKCSDSECVSMPISSAIKSKSYVKMDLQAIICNDVDFFIAFIKKSGTCDEWLRFSSAEEHRIPCVTYDNHIKEFFSFSEREMQRLIFGQVRRYLRQLINDSYVYIYSNSTVTCY